jgi:hypothetical protein
LPARLDALQAVADEVARVSEQKAEDAAEKSAEIVPLKTRKRV